MSRSSEQSTEEAYIRSDFISSKDIPLLGKTEYDEINLDLMDTKQFCKLLCKFGLQYQSKHQININLYYISIRHMT